MTALNTPIAVNERCDPRLVAAIESFQRAIDVRMRMESRRLPARSVKLLAIEHVAPALDAITSELAGRSFLPPIVFKATIDKPLHLHWLARTVIRNLRCAGVDETTASVTADAMREVGHFLALWPKTVRVVPQAMRGEKGALMQLRHVEDRAGLIDWPYCELCWRLTESAYRLECDAGKTKLDELKKLSEHFCAEHARVSGTLYRKDQKNKARSQNLLQAIYAEISSDVADAKEPTKSNIIAAIYAEISSNSAYRERFTSSRDDEIWQEAKSMSPEDLYKFASRDLPPFSPLQMRVRLAAYRIACYSPRQIARVVAIKKMQRSALVTQGVVMTMSEIGLHFGVTKQEVSRRLNALGGCIDFNTQNELLRWWPFDGLVGRDVVNVGNRKSDAAADEWSAPIERYLQEIYSGLPEARAALNSLALRRWHRACQPNLQRAGACNA